MKKIGKQIAGILRNTWYVHDYRHSALEERTILMESKHGEDIAGNIFYLLRELAARPGYQICLVLRKSRRARFTAWLQEEGLTGIRLVEPGSLAYYRLLARAHYLWTDTSFPPRYIKKKGQIVVNTWHGTPMKAMGQEDCSEARLMGNIQRNLLFADYLIFPNPFMEKVMLHSYGLEALYTGQVLREEYPRNTILTDASARGSMRETLGLADKELIVYMPTWRGQSTEKAMMQQERITEFLQTMERELTDSQVLYVKLHPFIQDKLSLEGYQHIQDFPTNWETYRVLSAADRLITDYSSVLYDFMNTGRPILLYPYDEDEYARERGFCLCPEELGLPIARTPDEIRRWVVAPEPLPKELPPIYCLYESEGAAGRIVRQVLSEVPPKRPRPDGETVLFFAGAWLKNGITTAAVNLLQQEGDRDPVYYVAFDPGKLSGEPELLRQLPAKVRWLPMSGGRQYTLSDMIWLGLYYLLHLQSGFLQRRVDRFFSREKERLFSGMDFDTVIQYEGYGRSVTQLFEQLPGRKAIFVHNHMQRELACKKNQDPLVLRKAYQSYDRVAIVTEDLREPTMAVGADPERIRVVNNLLDADSVQSRGAKELRYDEDTRATLSVQKLEALLDGPTTKIVTVGRFAEEKGHDQLIRAFESFHAQHPATDLILIGGYGPLYEQTCHRAAQSPAAEHIHILRALKNPMPIVRRCDLFVLSSHYEGQGLTLLEADALGLPTLSTRVCGPTGILERYGGYLVPDSAEGIRAGLEAYLRGEVKPMHIDFAQYNREALRQYEELWKGPVHEKNL